MPCSRKFPALCEVPEKEVFILRGKYWRNTFQIFWFRSLIFLFCLLNYIGLCPTTSFDTHYGWPWFLKDNSTSFLGFKKSVLKWNGLAKEWKISLYDNPYTYATLNGSFGSVFGTSKWHIFNDSCDEIDQNVFTSQLSFSRCLADEFNCEDGSWYAILVYLVVFWYSTQMFIYFWTPLILA